MIHSLFPSSIYSAALAPRATRLRRELLRECYQIRDFDRDGQRWSKKNYPGGFTSYGSMDRLHRFSSTFAELERHLNRHMVRFVRDLEMDVDPRELTLSTCWVNIMPQGVTHSMHIHPLSVLSGTYYVATPPGGGDLKFEDPRMECFMASPPRRADARPANQRYFRFRPSAGDVVLFESWMRHEVAANRGRRDRISISFNFDWTGR